LKHCANGPPSRWSDRTRTDRLPIKNGALLLSNQEALCLPDFRLTERGSTPLIPAVLKRSPLGARASGPSPRRKWNLTILSGPSGCLPSSPVNGPTAENTGHPQGVPLQIEIGRWVTFAASLGRTMRAGGPRLDFGQKMRSLRYRSSFFSLIFVLLGNHSA
jgi:hypothetical protein